MQAIGPGLNVRSGGVVRSYWGSPTRPFKMIWAVSYDRIIEHVEGTVFGTGLNRSFKRGVRLSRVFVRRGSTVFVSGFWKWRIQFF